MALFFPAAHFRAGDTADITGPIDPSTIQSTRPTRSDEVRGGAERGFTMRLPGFRFDDAWLVEANGHPTRLVRQRYAFG
jgi:hypothetical protein